jgi:fructokinase
MGSYRCLVITVIGEALIDLVSRADGLAGALTVEARPGGGPYNTARTIGRLGVPVSFAGRLADDPFGRLLLSGLSDSHVIVGVPGLTAVPTTLAVASIDSYGAADYSFYLEGTSAADLEYQDLVAALPADLSAVYAGALGLVLEPVASSVSRLIAEGMPTNALLMLDPNCRPAAIPSREAYLARLRQLASRTDILKASVEDLAFISPGKSPAEAAARLLSAGARLVLVTDGPNPARAFLSSGEVVATPVPSVQVVDTIGAGDALGGAFLAWWVHRGLDRADLPRPGAVAEALRFAAQVATITCTRVGADPPRIDVGWPLAPPA